MEAVGENEKAFSKAVCSLQEVFLHQDSSASFFGRDRLEICFYSNGRLSRSAPDSPQVLHRI